MIPELSRPVAVDKIGSAGLGKIVEATPEECRAVAARLGVPAVVSLTCVFNLTRGADVARGEIVAEGKLSAVLVRTCVVSLDDFEQPMTENFRVRFVAAGTERDDDDPEGDDELPYSGASIDLGETAVEQLALDLDPYPRRPDASLPDEVTDLAESPFAALRRRK